MVFYFEAGNISSPNYPNNYPRTASAGTENTTWTLEAEVGCRIKLTFEEFDVEDNSNCKCKYDYVKLSNTSYDGKICGSIRRKLCGPDRPITTPAEPVTFTSDGTIMNVYFEWDHIESKTGFLAKWESVLNNTIDNNE